LAEGRRNLKVLPVKVSSLPSPVGFITVRDRTLTPLAERFIECARKVAKSEVGRASTRRFQYLPRHLARDGV
jgi:hypothetical protein